MKHVLIMVVSSQEPPYNRMADTQKETWDSIPVNNCETFFYFGGGEKKEHDGYNLYFDIPESYHNMTIKTVRAFEWVLENAYPFDYVARVNSSTYVNKKKLVEYVQTLPDKKVFNGLVVKGNGTYQNDWCWGPFFILSTDVVRKIVRNQKLLNRQVMDDLAISGLLTSLGVPPTSGMGCSIDKSSEDKWRAICYGSESFEFTDFSEITKAKDHWAFRCKQDHDRFQDRYVMLEIFKHLPI